MTEESGGGVGDEAVECREEMMYKARKEEGERQERGSTSRV